MALVIIYAVLSHFDLVAKYTVKNLNKDFTNTGRGGGGQNFIKVFHKIGVFFKGWRPLGFDPYVPKSLFGKADLIKRLFHLRLFLIVFCFLLLLLYICSLKPFECE